MSIAILSFRQDYWDQHIPAIQERGFQAHRPTSYEELAGIISREAAGSAPVKLVVIDLPYNWDTLRKSVVRVLRMDGKINVAMVSGLQEDEAREEFKGLGLMLSMPQHPSRNVVTLLLNNLRDVLAGRRVIQRDPLP